ncbi:hypothetical protein [Dechloromonas agitata]|uniref:hypothetical protein n=1 Tax=Dechloromonas agitata TaxID=73030 RepID=UPI0012FBDAAE|nr:hypothetical protein [Dechloromonas agitata]
MLPPFNYSSIGEREECPQQVIARAWRTDKTSPVIQSTTTRKTGEPEREFIDRLREALRDLILPYGFAHHITLFCRYKIINDSFSNDTYQNLSAKLRYTIKNSDNHMERVNAASLLADIVSTKGCP